MKTSFWILLIIIVLIVMGYLLVAKAPQKANYSSTATSPTTSSPIPPNPQPAPIKPLPVTSKPEVSSGVREPSRVTPPKDSQAPVAKNVKEFIVEGGEFTFTPQTLSVSPGQKVRITFVNKGAISHNFVINGVVTGPIISAGSKTTVEFSAPIKLGTYPFYCSVGSHRSLGMEGQLTVQ